VNEIDAFVFAVIAAPAMTWETSSLIPIHP
jgi:hypothetical protein